jgi:hypothetical protein
MRGVHGSARSPQTESRSGSSRLGTHAGSQPPATGHSRPPTVYREQRVSRETKDTQTEGEQIETILSRKVEEADQFRIEVVCAREVSALPLLLGAAVEDEKLELGLAHTLGALRVAVTEEEKRGDEREKSRTAVPEGGRAVSKRRVEQVSMT